VSEYEPPDDPTPEAMKDALLAFNLRRWNHGKGLIDPLEFRDCRELTCNEGLVFLANPATGRVVPICDLHGQNHYRCCTNPKRFTRSTRAGGINPPIPQNPPASFSG
jgi:hypothetical protein